MFKTINPSYIRSYQEAILAIESELKSADITLHLSRKRVKNINFRLKPNQLNVSVPTHASDADIVLAMSKRLTWAINQHAVLLKRRQQAKRQMSEPSKQWSLNTLKPGETTLWGEPQHVVMGDAERIEWYRRELKSVMPDLFAKWQPVVGKRAAETRVKKMKTRWGTCNTKAKRVWLSVYLPMYPIECTEYVIVHELCHLHHANHSNKFWAEVERAMPDYKRWHNMLAV